MTRSQPSGCLAPTLLILGMCAVAMAVDQRHALLAWALNLPDGAFLWLLVFAAFIAGAAFAVLVDQVAFRRARASAQGARS